MDLIMQAFEIRAAEMLRNYPYGGDISVAMLVELQRRAYNCAVIVINANLGKLQYALIEAAPTPAPSDTPSPPPSAPSP